MLISVNELKVNDIFRAAVNGHDYVVESFSYPYFSILNMVTQKQLELNFYYSTQVYLYAKMTHININDVQAGDTVYHNNIMHTVCKNNITKGGFMGTAIFGDSYKSGHKLVKKITFLGR